MNLLKKEEVIREANDGNLEHVLEYLFLTEREQFITNEERDFLYWSALTNNFNILSDKFEGYKKKRDYLGLIDSVNSLINIYNRMEAFVEKDVNGYFSAEDDDLEGEKNEEEKIKFKKMILEQTEEDVSYDGDLFNYKGVKKIVNIRRRELVEILREFILLSKDIFYEITVPTKNKS